MKKKDKKDKDKKKIGNVKIILFTIGGVLVALFILYLLLYVAEYSKNMVWHSGKVLVGENIVSIPCSIEDFERSFNPEIQFVKDEESVRKVNISGYKFSIYLDKNDVIGVSLLDDDNSSELNSSIIFPGDITLDSSFSDVKKTYSTSPLNVFSRGCFVDLPAGEEHECVKYANNKWEIEVYSIDKKISSIRYFYIG